MSDTPDDINSDYGDYDDDLDLELAEHVPTGMTMLPGYGGWINPAYIVKIDVSRQGSLYQVLAWTSAQHQPQASFCALSDKFESEAEAMAECERLVKLWFHTPVPPGRKGALWPEPAS